MKTKKMVLVLAFLTSIIGIHAQEVGEYEDMRNGRVYKTVQIGTQLWLAENLKVTEFSDGSEIPYVDNQTTWAKLRTPAYCWYNNDIKNKDSYGALYNYYAVIDERNICPTRFHVPTAEDWKVLVNFLSKKYSVGTNITNAPDIAKSMASTTGWLENSNPGKVGNDQTSNNKSGFNAVPSGILGGTGFQSLGKGSCWWTTTKDKGSSVQIISAMISSSLAILNFSSVYPDNGLSIRCVAY